RIRWTQGHIDEAIAVLPEGARRTRLIDERLCLQPGWWPKVPNYVMARPACSPAEATRPPAALHVLTNSLPHTRSGYAYRSHAILTTLQNAGHQVAAETRSTYPVTLWRISYGPILEVDDVELPYHVTSR